MKYNGWLKTILQHHTFYGAVRLTAVFGIFFLVVFYLNSTIHRKINELANGHALINFYRLFYRNFQSPVSTKTHIAFTSGGVYIYTGDR